MFWLDSKAKQHLHGRDNILKTPLIFSSSDSWRSSSNRNKLKIGTASLQWIRNPTWIFKSVLYIQQGGCEGGDEQWQASLLTTVFGCDSTITITSQKLTQRTKNDTNFATSWTTTKVCWEQQKKTTWWRRHTSSPRVWLLTNQSMKEQLWLHRHAPPVPLVLYLAANTLLSINARFRVTDYYKAGVSKSFSLSTTSGLWLPSKGLLQL